MSEQARFVPEEKAAAAAAETKRPNMQANYRQGWSPHYIIGLSGICLARAGMAVVETASGVCLSAVGIHFVLKHFGSLG